jgi:hypothetical protein
MRAWQANDVRNRPFIEARATTFGRRDGSVFSGPGDIVAANGLVPVLKDEIVGVTEG